MTAKVPIYLYLEGLGGRFTPKFRLDTMSPEELTVLENLMGRYYEGPSPIARAVVEIQVKPSESLYSYAESRGIYAYKEQRRNQVTLKKGLPDNLGLVELVGDFNKLMEEI